MDNAKEIHAKEGNGSSTQPPRPPVALEPTSTYDTLLEYISEMLMEEEEEFCNNPFMLHDSLALQATEKSLHDALYNINLDTTCRKSLHHSHPNSSGVMKNYHSREDSCDMFEHHKQSANNNTDDESELLEMYDDVLICPSSDQNEQSKGNDRDAVLQFISEMLIEEEEEEELGNNPNCILHHVLPLQATENSLHDALHNTNLDTTCRKSLPHSRPNSSGVKKNYRSQNDSCDMSDHHKKPSNNNAEDDSEALEIYDDVLICPSSDRNEQSKGNEQDAVLQFISEILMEEEELENNPSCMLNDGLALQATEKSLHDALHNINLDTTSRKSLHHSPSSSGVKKNHRSREESFDWSEHHRRSHKQSANNKAYDDEESEPLKMYDDFLLCPNLNRKVHICGQTAKRKPSFQNEQSIRGPKPRSGGGKKNADIIDLRSLLMRCAEAVAKVDNKTVNDLLREIRQHSSPKGNVMERLAHYFADALEARLACTGTDLYTALDSKKISAAEVLKAYKVFVNACPFKLMSNMLANKTIIKMASTVATLHIIDFGILYGFQWPCLIQVLSQRLGGPPKIRITGIDFPQPGFRPTERVAATGHRLAKWAERFGVPYEYNVIAKKWDTIRVKDVKIEKNEFLVVNCMYRLHNVSDDTETGDSPRDVVLKLIKKINPDLFVHGVANGAYHTPFFVPRFKEALFHFSSMFDMFDATIPRDDKDRMLFEEQIFGKEAMNIIACEGTERVERPETYKQWQTRTLRAGFEQVSLDQEIVKKLRKVKMYYHNNFSVDECGKWILIGWKGRVIEGFSCWRPTHKLSSS